MGQTSSLLGKQITRQPSSPQAFTLKPAEIADLYVDSKIDAAMQAFQRDQETALENERLALATKSQIIEAEIVAMQKLAVELKAKAATVQAILEREQQLSDEFAENAAKTREAIESGNRYVEHLRHRLATAEQARLQTEDNRRLAHRDLGAEIEAMIRDRNSLRNDLDEAVEERDDLVARWQAKMEVQRQSDLESSRP